MDIDALALLEVRGYVVAIEAADAMLKSAAVRLLKVHQLNPGMISLVVEGDLAACRAAADAGVAAAQRLGEVVSRIEIGRPDDDTAAFVQGFFDASPSPKSKVTQGDLPPPVVTALPVAPIVESQETPMAVPSEVTPSSSPEIPTDCAANVNQQALLDYIASSERGLTWTQLMKQFPQDKTQLRALLDALLDQNLIVKSGHRFHCITDE